ncbi:pyruvate kinase [Mucilaginibacter ginsenosidivorans]|uniref:Pyruvate kinase n=1 Tax=Mucilaginibacter ginsenosidivorans TaxID=398053 RepID=A0A5B8V228_9SPHI|nr:pyruvate kinase [Mucilaginibacter ginsenosidivorans]QEC65238.1 pyruvate kinase [Mucilaginibacter ginsenosidivorans]
MLIEQLDTAPMKHTEEVLKDLKKIYEEMLDAELKHRDTIQGVKVCYRNSAINLIDYLSLRSKNVETLQVKLHESGLSSLASSESHIKSQLMQVMERLGDKPSCGCEVDVESGIRHLQHNITGLLGGAPTDQTIPVMVTFDTNFENDFDLICSLLENGMRVARINCAHDNPETWTRMILNLEQAKKQTAQPCKLYMDLAGPKIRTHIVGRKHQRGKLKVAEGDEVILTDQENHFKKSEKVIHCTLPGIVEYLQPGHRVFFDDGLFEAVVQNAENKSAVLMITHIATKKPVIKSDKGINFPDTGFSVTPVTKYDLECLPFIVQHADMLGFSFVNSAADMKALQRELSRLNKSAFPVIAKIETKQAVDHLPEIILQGMKQGPTGVMVARGDMAIEIGFERMSEIQDEILWICEAAHTPVVWATQVLENMQKQGIATRGEITDAAHAAQADCVMINKGDYTLQVLHTLKDILKRGRKNNFKNRRLFRSLSIASHFIGDK